MTDNNQVLTPVESDAGQTANAAIQLNETIPEPQVLKRNGKKKNPRRRKLIKRIVAIVIAVAVLGGGAFGLYELLRDKTEEHIQTAEAFIGSMSTNVYASGQTRAKRTEEVFITARSKINEVLVVLGQQVTEGEILYTVDSSELIGDIANAQKALDDARKTLTGILESINNLNITAPFAGKLTGVAIKEGDTVSPGMVLARLTDDSSMKLKQYFSYAYKDMIKPGMSVNVSIPASLSQVTGTVSEVAYVERITPEGVTLFEVNITVKNPGTLTEGMSATCSIPSSGEIMTPYEAGELEYNKAADIVAMTGGKVVSLNMRDYEKVSAGKLLVALEGENLDDAVKAAEKTVADRQKELDELLAQQNSGGVPAPISGVVTSVGISPGDTVEPGFKAFTIADLSDIKIQAQVNEMDIGFLQVGMMATINQDSYEGLKQTMGMIEDISLTAEGQYGVSYFPVTISAQNAEGALKPGMSVWIEILANQRDGCVMVPNEAIKNMPDGSICVFIKADAPPENYIDEAQFGEVDIVPDGFYAIPVEVGMADAVNAEIISGLNPGDMVFTGITNQPNPDDGYGGGIGKPGVIYY